MKIHVILMALFIGAHPLCSQESFHKFMGNPLNTYDRAGLMASTPDGGFIVTGATTGYGNGRSDAFLMKVGADGRQEWYKTYGDTLDDEGLSVCLAQGGGYVFSGYTESTADGKTDGWVVCLTGNGTILWDRKFSIGGVERVNSIRPTPDGKYAICGNTVTGSFSGQDVFIALLDNNGFPLDNQIIATTALDQGLFVEAATNGTIAVAYQSGNSYKLALFSPTLDEIKDIALNAISDPISTIHSLTNDGTDHFCVGGWNTGKPVIARVTSAGDIAWTRTLPDIYGEVVSIIPASGNLNALITNGLNSYLWMLDPAGTTLSNEKVTFPNNIDVVSMTFDNMQRPVVLGNVYLVGEQADFQLIGISGMQTQPTVLWTKLHGKTGYRDNEFGYALCRASDGGYVLCAERYNEISGADTWVVKINESGDIVWETSLSFSQNPETPESCWSIEPCADGGFILVTTTFNTFTLAKLNAEGALLWDKTYKFQNINQIRAILKPLSDGGFAGVAKMSVSGGSQRATVLRFNSIGDTLWTRSFGAVSDIPYDLEPLSDNSLVIGGRKRVGTAQPVTLAWLMRIGPNGNLIWEQTYGAPSNFARCFDVAVAADGNIVSTGYAFENSGASQVVRNLVLKASAATGQVIWERKWSHEPDSSIFYGYNIVQAPDGGFYVGGLGAEFAQNMPGNVTLPTRRLIVQKIGPDGHEIWRKTTDAERAAAVAYAGVVTEDGGYMLCGGGTNGSSTDVLIAKFGADETPDFAGAMAAFPAKLTAMTPVNDNVARISLKSQESSEIARLRIPNSDSTTPSPEAVGIKAELMEQEMDLWGLVSGNYFLQSKLQNKRASFRP